MRRCYLLLVIELSAQVWLEQVVCLVAEVWVQGWGQDLNQHLSELGHLVQVANALHCESVKHQKTVQKENLMMSKSIQRYLKKERSHPECLSPPHPLQLVEFPNCTKRRAVVFLLKWLNKQKFAETLGLCDNRHVKTACPLFYVCLPSKINLL